MSLRPRVVVLTNVVAPYRAEFYRRLSAESALEVVFLFWGHRQFEKNWALREGDGIRGERLPRLHLGGDTTWPPTLGRRLRALQPALIVCGGASLPALLALRYARPRRVPLLLWWGGTRASEEGVSLLKRCWRRFLFGRVSGFLAYSELAAAFLRDHAGVGAKPIRVLGNNTMDGQAWADAVDALRPRPHPALVTLLGVGRLVPSKNYDLVLHALARLPAERRSCCRLVLVGDGPASAGLRALAAQLRLASQVELAGAVPQAEVAKFMAQAEVFVHPTTYDRWPQVINEAMAAGLAVVVSDRAGVPDDYLRPGENGGVCRPGDEAAWTEQLGRLIAEAPLRQRLGAAARTTALSRDVRFAQAQFVRAVQENLVI